MFARSEPVTAAQPSFEETDPTVATPARNFGSGAAARTINEVDPDGEAEAAARTIAYAEALELARQAGIRRVIVFGCRAGAELAAAFGDSSADVTGVDFPTPSSAPASASPIGRGPPAT
jgi:hypothetical protein